MRRVATGLLVVDGGAVCRSRGSASRIIPAWSYVRAFAEAAMVGGLADWFAVTALFRHPLGLPIPHTAIIPRNKDRIGDSLASFLRQNFLTPSVVARRMRRLDLAGAAGPLPRRPLRTGRACRPAAARRVATDRRSGRRARRRAAGRHGARRGVAAAHRARRRADPRPGARRRDRPRPPRAAARRRDRLARPHAGRQRGHNPRDDLSQGGIGDCAGRGSTRSSRTRSSMGSTD